jgi:cytoskeletal protein CcmA (bactofilin family)
MDNDARAKNLNQLLESSGAAADTSRAYLPKQSSASKQGSDDATGRRHELSVLGKSVVFKGEFEANEDLLIDGRVEGKITHRAEHLTIGPNGDVKADIMAQRVLVQGRVTGNIRATETIVIEPSAHVAGNLFAPRVGLEEGAEFDGRIQMTRSAADASKAQSGETRSSASVGREQPSVERADARTTAKRTSSAKKTAASGATGTSDARVNDLLE